ncbi:MAG: glycosyltransferase family 9 protein [Gammaproteobacteria bacterium]|nr:MAG: glycosyltransferase family 9 protein [Gammaproteobacteria bacterium]
MITPLTPLLVRFGRMGDMVLQAPLLHLLHRRYGHPCTLLSAGSWSRALYAGSEDVAAIWQLRGRHTPFILSPQRWLLARALRRHTGPIYVSEDVEKQRRRIRALLARAGVDGERCMFIDPAASDVHWVDRLLEFGMLTPPAFDAAAYAWHEADLQRAPHLPIDAADHRDLDAWLRSREIDAAPLVLIQPGNNRTNRRRGSRQSDSKAWPLERWIAVIHAIRAQHPAMRFILCGGASETAMLGEIRQRCAIDRVDVATRDLPLRRLLALAERSHGMIAVDTGPAHLAAAAGCPLIVLYGAESPARWDRRSAHGSEVINLGGPPQRTRVDEISADEVISAWQRLCAKSYGKELTAASAA